MGCVCGRLVGWCGAPLAVSGALRDQRRGSWETTPTVRRWDHDSGREGARGESARAEEFGRDVPRSQRRASSIWWWDRSKWPDRRRRAVRVHGWRSEARLWGHHGQVAIGWSAHHRRHDRGSVRLGWWNWRIPDGRREEGSLTLRLGEHRSIMCTGR